MKKIKPLKSSHKSSKSIFGFFRSASGIAISILTIAAIGLSLAVAFKLIPLGRADYPYLQWGSYGSNAGQFIYPQGIAINDSDEVYVADTDNNRIQKFDSSGTWLATIGSYGSNDGQFYSPSGIAIDHSGNVYVGDVLNDRIQKFDSSGNWVLSWGSYGGGNSQFVRPYALTINNADSSVYVADTYNNRIQVFDSAGTYISQWGTTGTGNGEFNWPTGITIDGSNNVYVSDMYNNRVQKFDSEGVYISQWGTYGSNEGQLHYPAGAEVDSSGNIYVADSYNHRIEKFNSSGTFLSSIGSYGSGDGEFIYPNDIAFDSDGLIYVADTWNHRIQRCSTTGCIALTPTPTPVVTWDISTVDSAGDVGTDTSIALDSAGYPHISYKVLNGGLKFAEWNGSSWSIVSLDPTVAKVAFTSIALDSSGNPYISYWDVTNGKLKCAKRLSGTWSYSQVDATPTINAVIDTSIAVDSNGNPQISYIAMVMTYVGFPPTVQINYQLKYAKWNGSAWSAPATIVVASNNQSVPSFTSIALDSSNNPHIGYYDGTNGYLKYAKNANGSGCLLGTWTCTTVDSSANVGAFNSIALDSSNYPHIGYYDQTNGDLKYAKWNGSTWDTSTVDSSADDVGWDASLKLDSGGNPHISYFDKTNEDLKYAEWTGSSWSISMVDGAGIAGPKVGQFNSLVLDSSGNPHISYYAQTNGDLKYAKSAAPVPTETPTETPNGFNLIQTILPSTESQTVANASGELALDLPPSESSYTVSIEKTDVGQGNLHLETDIGSGSAVYYYSISFTPPQTFPEPGVLVTMHYPDSFTPSQESTLKLFYYNTDTSTWDNLTIYSMDTDANTISFYATHFSEFALAVMDETATTTPTFTPTYTSTFTSTYTPTPTFTPTNATIHIWTDKNTLVLEKNKWKPTWQPLVDDPVGERYMVELYDYNLIKAEYKACKEENENLPEDEEENCIKTNAYEAIRSTYMPLLVDYPTIIATKGSKIYSDAVFNVLAQPKGVHPYSKYLAIGVYDDEQFKGKGNLLVRTIKIYAGETKTRKMHVSLIDNQPKSMKMTTVTGSGELDIYEPEYVTQGTTIYYPYVFEARDDWDVTITLEPPAGYSADKTQETLSIPPSAIDSAVFVLTSNGTSASSNGVAVANAAEISQIKSTIVYKVKNSTDGPKSYSNVAEVISPQATPTPVPTTPEAVPQDNTVLGMETTLGYTVFGVIAAALLALIGWMIAVLVRTRPKRK